MDVTPTRRHNEHTFVMLTLKFNKKQISKVVMVFTTHICVVGLLRVNWPKILQNLPLKN